MKNPFLQLLSQCFLCHTKEMIKKQTFFVCVWGGRFQCLIVICTLFLFWESCPEISFHSIQQHMVYTDQYLEEFTPSSYVMLPCICRKNFFQLTMFVHVYTHKACVLIRSHIFYNIVAFYFGYFNQVSYALSIFSEYFISSLTLQ